MERETKDLEKQSKIKKKTRGRVMERETKDLEKQS